MYISTTKGNKKMDDVEFCQVCDGAHNGGEFGELCLANGRGWFEPSDPRELEDEPQASGFTSEVWW
jgi:hypothetical protein